MIHNMKNNKVKIFVITFIVNIIIGMLFNAMNMMAYDFNHLYFSVTLFYVGCIMASNMVWSHEIIHYLTMGHFNTNMFLFGIILTLFFVYLARNQVGVNTNQWLRRMIPHHSTALTTSEKLLEKIGNQETNENINNNTNGKNDKKVYRLAKDIIFNQNAEIHYMKTFLKNNKYNKN